MMMLLDGNYTFLLLTATMLVLFGIMDTSVNGESTTVGTPKQPSLLAPLVKPPVPRHIDLRSCEMCLKLRRGV